MTVELSTGTPPDDQAERSAPSPPVRGVRSRRARVRAVLASREGLRDLVLLREVFGAPVGLRDPRSRSGL